MADCSNVEIRELLPERVSGALSAADLARVDAHLASCELCTSELALIESARRVLRRTPQVDLARIAVAVRATTASPARPVLVGGGAHVAPRPARTRWIGWKAAAAIALAAAGGGTMLVWQRADDRGAPASVAATTASAPAPANGAAAGGASATVAAAQSGGAGEVRPALNVAGGLSDLTDSDLQALLDDMGSIGVDAQSFEEPEPVLPQLPGSEGTES